MVNSIPNLRHIYAYDDTDLGHRGFKLCFAAGQHQAMTKTKIDWFLAVLDSTHAAISPNMMLSRWLSEYMAISLFIHSLNQIS